MPITLPLRVSSFALLAAALLPAIAATPATAQFIQGLPDPNSPVERLGRFIRVLAGSPRDLNALIGAGTAALDVGDANAALGFFSRAEEISPSSGRAKAGLGAALANIEKPDDALRLFAQGASLGASPADFARDRALAYDLTGDWRRAQRDYALALQTHPDDDEAVRRYALSLGISGDRVRALQVLDPLLRRQDQGAWRARAFIYAMTGDVGQANVVARQLMPAPMAASMSPLLSRLATLNPAERAHAVNFGTVPGDGTRMASVDTSQALPAYAAPYARADAPTLAGAYASRSASGALASNGPSSGPSSGLIPAGEPLGRRGGPAATGTRTVQLAARDAVPGSGPATGPARLVALPAPTTPTPALTQSLRPAPRREPFDPGPLSAASVSRRVGPRIGPVDPVRLPPEARMVTALATPVVTLPPTATLPPASSASTTTRNVIGGDPTANYGATGDGAPRVTVLERTTLPPPTGVPVAPPAPTRVTLLATTTLPPPSTPGISGGNSGGTSGAASLIGPPALVGSTLPTKPAAVSPQEPVDAAVAAPAFETPTPSFTRPVVPVPSAPPPVSQPRAGGSRLAGLLNGIAPEEESAATDLPSARDLRLARVAARRKVEQAAAKADEERVAKAEAAQAAADLRRNPSRLWVQVATGANERGLPLTWRRLRDGNATVLKGMSAYSVPFRATNRLLVGPVKSAAAARELVRSLGRNGVAATTYSSDAGQEVAAVGTR